MKEPYISVITALITGSITVHVMREVNPHCGGFSGDNFTPKTLINSSVCYCKGVAGKSWWRSLWLEVSGEDTDKELLFYQLVEFQFLPKSLWDSLLDRSCASPSIIWRESSQMILTFTRLMENKIYFPSLHQEFSFKQREDLSLNIFSLL